MNRTGSKGLGTEGIAGVEHLSTVAMVALVGLVGFATFGEAAETAIAGQTPSAATSSAALGTPGGPALTGQGAEAPPHGYTVQVVAYNTPEEAADYAQYLRDNFGVDAFAEPNEHGYYVVRVGNPGTPEEAENLRQDLLALGVPADTYVEQHSGTLTPGQVEFLEAVAEQEAAAEAEAAEAEVTEAPETEQPEAEEGDSGGGEDCSWYDAFCHGRNLLATVEDRLPEGGFVRGLYNFTTNFGMNPLSWVADPLGQLSRTWNNVWGVGQFAVGTVVGLGQLLHTVNTLYNPAYPGFWWDLASNGPSGFFDRRIGVLQAGLEHGGSFLSFLGGIPGDPGGSWEEFRDNALVQGLWEPIGNCAGESSAAAENACGQVAGDIILAVLTAGGGKAATSGGRVASAADDLGDAGRIADELGDASRAADEAADATRAADEAADATRADDAARAARVAETNRAVDDIAALQAELERTGATSAPAVQARIDQAVANTRALIERNIDNAADAARANALLDKIIRDTQKLQRIEARIGSSAAGEAATAARQAERVRDGIAAARDELNGLL